MATLCVSKEAGDFTPVDFPIKVPAGNSWSMRLWVKDTDLTGWTIRARVASEIGQDLDDQHVLTVTLVVGENEKVDVGELKASGPGYGRYAVTFIPPGGTDGGHTWFAGDYLCPPYPARSDP